MCTNQRTLIIQSACLLLNALANQDPKQPLPLPRLTENLHESELISKSRSRQRAPTLNSIPPAMESLWVEDEFDATLEEILAFVDSSFDLKDDSTDSNQTSSVFSVDWDRSVHRSSVGDIHTDKPSHKKSAEHCQSHKQCVRRSKSRVENNNAVRKYRKRNKEEIIELRRKLHQMETQLTYLRANRNHARQLENPGGAGNLEFQNLQQARQINRALKISLAEYTNMSKIPHDLLKKRTTKQFVVFNCVGSKFLVWDRGFSMANSTFGCVDGGELHAIVSAELDHYLGALYLSTLEIARPVAWQEHSETLFATIDPVRGQMYEMTSTTPVNWSVLQLVNYVWSNLTATDCHDHRFMMAKSGSTSHSCQKQTTMVSNSPQFGRIPIRGVSSLRRFDELDRSVIVFTSHPAISEVGLLFREEGWTIISKICDPSESLSPSTQLQTFYRAFGEINAATVAAMPQESLQLRDFVLMAITQRMRVHILRS